MSTIKGTSPPRRAQDTGEAARAVLKQVEWAGYKLVDGDGGLFTGRCPSCKAWKDAGHSPTCELARALEANL